ncbi:MAG: hypothetical protein K6G07_02295 [Lachnospiraceae bacterium]|nr:hypothetical protein [Lachnospiraceae bacterium]
MKIAAESMVTLYTDFMAIMLVLGLVVLSYRLKKDKIENKIFLAMCFSLIADALGGILTYSMHYQTAPWTRYVSFFGKTLMELGAGLMLYQWIVYVDYKLYHSLDHFKRNYRGFFVPLLIFMVLLLVNPFIHLMFDIGENNWAEPTILYHVMEVLELLYFFFTFVLILQARKKKVKMHFFHIRPLLIPILLAIVMAELTNYSAIPLGFAIGLVNLYFSMVNAWQYEDAQTGFYNTAYLELLEEQIKTGAQDVRSVIIMEANGDHEAFVKHLQASVPRDRNLVQLSDDRFAIFEANGKRTLMDMVIALMEEDMEEYDEEHPDAKVELKVNGYIRKKGEDAIEFVHKYI